MKADPPIVAARRVRLQAWIDSEFGGKQAAFKLATGINQGELSGLLNAKSFGEVKAANIEAQAKMPAGYLVKALDPVGGVEDDADMADALAFTLTATLRAVAEHSPDLGRALRRSFAGLTGVSETHTQVIKAAISAVEEGLQSWESADPLAARGGSSGTQSRRGR